MKKPPQAGRTEREAAAWDRIYACGTRARARKFYEAAAEARRQHWRLIKGSCVGQRVLELGCGTGRRAAELARLDATVVGIDISGEAIRMAQQRPGDKDRLTFVQMDAEAMSFPDHQFNLVCGNAILHHLDLRTACREIARVLKPGGRAIFLEPLGHNVLINLYRRLSPAMRTTDEHPLLAGDINTIAAHFAETHVHFHVLTALAAVPFRRVPGAARLFNALHALDRALFHLPACRWQAWQVVIEARVRPQGGQTPTVGGSAAD